MSTSISAIGSNLGRRTRDFSEAWQRTRESWRDAKSDEFGRTYIEPLVESVQSASKTIDELDRIIRKIRKDCAE